MFQLPGTALKKSSLENFFESGVVRFVQSSETFADAGFEWSILFEAIERRLNRGLP
jgi:hypothetical protein